jgi:hypothetical protein
MNLLLLLKIYMRVGEINNHLLEKFGYQLIMVEVGVNHLELLKIISVLPPVLMVVF